jgi:hypothetical protein
MRLDLRRYSRQLLASRQSPTVEMAATTRAPVQATGHDALVKVLTRWIRPAFLHVFSFPGMWQKFPPAGDPHCSKRQLLAGRRRRMEDGGWARVALLHRTRTQKSPCRDPRCARAVRTPSSVATESSHVYNWLRTVHQLTLPVGLMLELGITAFPRRASASLMQGENTTPPSQHLNRSRTSRLAQTAALRRVMTISNLLPVRSSHWRARAGSDFQ